MFCLFLIVLAYNIYFLVIWLFRFISVVLRINIDNFRRFQICQWLNHVKMQTYEEDLASYVRHAKDSLNTEDTPKGQCI